MGVKIKNRKGKARTGMHGKAITQKERWSEVVVTYTTPTKPDAVMPERILPKQKKKRRSNEDFNKPVLDGLESWEQLNPRMKERLESKAVVDLERTKTAIK
jgi:hypothetical protein